MAPSQFRGLLLDVDYLDSGGKSQIRLFVRTEKGIEFFFDRHFKPYFFVKCRDREKAAKEIKKRVFGEGARASAVGDGKAGTLKVEFNSVSDLKDARGEIASIEGVDEALEFDIPFAKRYLIDRQLEPMGCVELLADGSNVKEVRAGGEPAARLNYAAFDIETLSPERFSDPEKDPIIMVSFFSQKKRVLFTTSRALAGEKDVVVCASEAEMIRCFLELLRAEKIDVLVTYNGDNFDLPYVKARARALGMNALFYPAGEEPSIKRAGRDNAARLHGIQHLDAYQLLRFLNRFGVVSLIKFDLESVASALFKKEKEKISAEEINRIWREGKGLERLAEYCLEDSETALRIAGQYSPLIAELCKLVKQTMFDASRASASMLVEYLLLNRAFVEKRLVPNKPRESEAGRRLLESYKGGYVKEPLPGLHERLAVLDFSSLHPSIIISHNISPETLDCKHSECGKNAAPNSHWFCTKKEGFLSGILKELFERRMAIKKKARDAKKEGRGKPLLEARQHALKILMNSFYGYLAYARSRWFCRECASAVTAWSRQYVREVGAKAEEAGFKLLYSDTDSAFLILPKEKGQEAVKRFVEQINSHLPGVMNLELEGFYKRGIFVTKESGEGAKKKYALIDYENNLKIVGFEYVRRDWALIAKETQRKVIKAILEEGNTEKAARIVKSAVERLRAGKVPKRELVVMTQLKRPLGKYEAIGPHVAAAQKAIKMGKKLGVGSVISYIITRSGKSISDKAQLEEFVGEGNYDADYYIENQVVPAVIKIMRELGYSKEDLIHGGKQKTLGAFWQHNLTGREG
jgi:DNA polymerase I